MKFQDFIYGINVRNQYKSSFDVVLCRFWVDQNGLDQLYRGEHNMWNNDQIKRFKEFQDCEYRIWWEGIKCLFNLSSGICRNIHSSAKSCIWWGSKIYPIQCSQLLGEGKAYISFICTLFWSRSLYHDVTRLPHVLSLHHCSSSLPHLGCGQSPRPNSWILQSNGSKCAISGIAIAVPLYERNYLKQL